MPRLPVPARPLRKLLREIESSGGGDHVLSVGGASELALVLRQQFLRGRAKPEAVRLGDPNGADVYVHVLAGELPALTLNQLRLVLRLAQVYGEDGGLARGPLLTAAHGAAFGWRSLARELARRVPFAPWALNGAVAYAGTRAFGDWARRSFALSATQRRAAIARAAP